MPKGKTKGNKYERLIKKKILSTFEELGITNTDAFRSILSGGHVESAGDISLSPALQKLFPFAVECKHYKKINLYELLKPWKKMGKSNVFKQWWNQAIEGAGKGALFPLLVFRSNSWPDMCLVYSKNLWSILPLKQNYFRKKHVPVIRVSHPKGELLCFPFDTLLKMLYKSAKKGLENAHSSTSGNRVRLRTSDTNTRKQMQKHSRPSRKNSGDSKRKSANSRVKHRNGTRLR